MLLSTVNPEAAEAIGTITKVGVGNCVVYHARAGYMRDRRTSFPALVLRQHEEDGSLDLLVFMEREDFAAEERVQFQSHNQLHHCWSAVEDRPGDTVTADPAMIETLYEAVKTLTARVFSLENKPKPGRPPSKPKAE